MPKEEPESGGEAGRIPPSLDEVLRARVKAIREELDWRQDDLARVMREVGLRWTRAMVAAFETGKRRLRLGELVALAVVLERPLQDLVKTNAQWVGVGEGAEIRRKDLDKVMGGTVPGPEMLRPAGEEDLGFEEFAAAKGVVERLLPRETPATLLLVGYGDLEQYLARKLDVSPWAVAAAGYRLWGHSPTIERDRRAASRPKAKQHISRQIRQQIEDAIQGMRKE